MNNAFNQEKFIKRVFRFMKVNNLKVRDFCASAKCSPMTLYRARDPAHPMERDTIVRITEAMKQHLKEIM